MKRLTLEEIAKLAGVSRATVSRVINGYAHVRPEVRDRVQAVIDQTGFHPHMVARSLASNRSNVIGLLIPNIVQRIFTDPYFASLIQGISHACNSRGLILSLYLMHSLEEERYVIRSVLGAGLIDGLIVTADGRTKELLNTLTNSHIPFVLVGRPNAPDKVSYIDADNFGGAVAAVEHLINLGHRRIMTIATELNNAGYDRLAGYQHAMKLYGLPVSPNYIAYGDFTLESGYEAMKQLLVHRPEAVFISSDTMALGALRALREAEISIPDEMAIVGFDDLPPALQAEPPLTTIRQPMQDAGTQAVDLLLTLLEQGQKPAQSRILPTTLVIRGTCGAQLNDPLLHG